MRTSFSTLGRLISVRLISATCWSRLGWIDDAGHQRPQQRLRVDVDARAGLVPLRNAHRDRDADDRDDPRGGQPDPAPMPHAAQARRDEFDGSRSCMGVRVGGRVRGPAAHQNQLCGMIRMSPGRMSTFAEMSPRRSGRAGARCRTCRPRPRGDRRAVAVGEVGQAADGDHHVEQRHVLAIRRGSAAWSPRPITRICSLTGPTKVVTTTVTTGSRMYLASAFSMSRASAVEVLPCADQVIDQGRRDLAVRPHRHRHRQLRIAPDDDVHGVERPDQVVVVGRGGLGRRRRVLGRLAGPEKQGDRDGAERPQDAANGPVAGQPRDQCIHRFTPVRRQTQKDGHTTR